MPIVTVSGLSGSGKTTLVRRMLEARPNIFRLVTSMTTRPARETDMQNEHEHVPESYIESLADTNNLLWHIRHGSALYATSKFSVGAYTHPWSKTGIMILNPEVLPTLIRHLGDESKEPPQCVFVHTNQKIIESRLAGSSRTNERAARKFTEKDWPQIARKHAAKWVYNNGGVEDTVAQILRVLGT